MYLAEIKESNHELAVTELDSKGDVWEEYTGVALTPYIHEPENLALTHRINRYLGKTSLEGDGFTETDRKSVLTMVEAADTDFEGSYRVRVKTVENQEASVESLERQVGSVLYDRDIDRSVDLENPDHDFRLVFTDRQCFLGKKLVETESFDDRKPTEKPYFRPGSMDTATSRALTNIAGGAGTLVLDPMCGTGGFMVEAGMCGAETVGFDVETEILTGARENLEYYTDNPHHLSLGDASRLPLADNSIDAVVTDLPYGKASLVEGESLDNLVQDVLEEAERVTKGRAVVVSDRWISEKARDAGFKISHQITDRVHRSLTRKIHVLDKK